MKNFILTALVLLSSYAFGQDYELNLSVTQNDRTANGEFKVKVQIRSATANAFDLGSSNIRFNYNQSVLQFVSLTPLNFSTPPFYATMTSTGSGFGFVSMNVILGLPGFGSTVGNNTSWTDVGELTFNILSNTGTLDFEFREQNNQAGQNVVFMDDESTLMIGNTANDQVVFNGITWVGGNGINGAPDATDAAKQIIVLADSAILTGEVECEYFIVALGAHLSVGSNATLRPFVQDANVGYDISDGKYGFSVDADITGYGQFIGPGVAGQINQFVGTDEGWRNMAFPIAASLAIDNELSLGGAPINMNSASTSYHDMPSTRDVCGIFGNWDNTANVYTFGAPNSAQPHEWYGASNTIGGTIGYSIFLGGNYFSTSGKISASGDFNAGLVSYNYAHQAPHASNTNGASQGLYTGVGCNADIEVPADRKANWDGWALVANPYPSGLDADIFALDNLLAPSAIRVWNKGKAFEVAGPGGIDYQYESMEGKIIPPMQAFFVKVGSDGTIASLDFNDDQRAFSSETFLKTPPSHIKLIAKNNADNAINHAILAFDPMATNGYDQAFDSYVLSQPRSKTPQIGFHNEYVSNGQTIVAPLYVSTVNEPVQPSSYPVRFWSRSAGNFSFSVDATLLEPNWQVFIEDTKVAPGISHNITNQAYNFSYILADSPMRFVLHYINTAFGVDENLTTAWSTTGWFDSQTNLVVNFAGTNLPSTVKIIVFDLAGKKLYASNNVETNSAFAIENNFTAGIYLLTVVGSNGESKVTKVVKSK